MVASSKTSRIVRRSKAWRDYGKSEKANKHFEKTHKEKHIKKK